MSDVKFNCPHCQQHLETTSESAGLTMPCPTCSQSLVVPSLDAVHGGGLSERAGPVCAICQSAMDRQESTIHCPECRAAYHEDCWQENGGCAVYGCPQVPPVEPRQSVDVPVSYWGQENKNCPSCGREILAAATRCRFCGATFESARPENAEEFQKRAARTERLPELRKKVVVLFVVSLVPCLAPVGAVAGLLWLPSNRHDIRALPSIYLALSKIGLAVAIGQTLILILMILMYQTSVGGISR